MIAQHSQGPLFSPQLSFGHLGWAAFALELYDKLFLFNDALFAISDKSERQGYSPFAIFAGSPHSASFPFKFGFADGADTSMSTPKEASTCLVISFDEVPSPS